MTRADFRNSNNAKEIVEFVFDVYANNRGRRVKITYEAIKKRLKNKLPSDDVILAQHKAWLNDPVYLLSKDHPVFKLAQIYYGDPIELSARNVDELQYGIISEPMKKSIIERIPIQSVEKLKHGFNSMKNFEIPEEVLSLIKDKRKMLFLEETKRGRKGVEIGIRLFVFLISQIPLKYRGEKIQCNVEITLRDIAKLIFPRSDDKGHFFEKARHEEVLKEGFRQLNSITVELQDKRLFRPVLVRTEPDYNNLDSKALILILWPSESDRGMRINLEVLIKEGKNAAKWKFDFNLALARYWDEGKRRNSGKRIYSRVPEVKRNMQEYLLDEGDYVILEKGKPILRWNHPKAVRTGRYILNPNIDRLSWLTYDDIYSMAFSLLQRNEITRKDTIKVMKNRIMNYIKDMAQRGYWEIVHDDTGKFKIVEIYKNSDSTALREW